MPALDAIINLITARLGLDPASIGLPTLERAIRHHARKAGCAEDLDAYTLALTPDDSPAWPPLLEAIVVKETSFLRHPEAFHLLRQHALAHWLPPAPAPRRLLSAPCSTGEEAYTLAITLLHAGLPPGSFQIDAWDISPSALAAAEKALYTQNSFRAPEARALRDTWFTPHPTGHLQLQPHARQPVTLRHANLLDPPPPHLHQAYDTILCRNLFIYLTPSAQATALHTLHTLLRPDGLLFVGPAETTLVRQTGHFHPADHPMAFAFTKAPPAPLPLPAPPPVIHHPQPRPRPPLPSAPPAIPAPSPPLPSDNLALARTLADQGQLDPAAQACRQHLRQNPESPDAHCLLGIILDATGHHHEAAAAYRRALYLHPRHPEAIAHLSLHLQRQSRPQEATRLLHRLQNP